MGNKRSMLRLKKALAVRLHWPSEESGTTIDLSAGGMLLWTRRIVAPGTDVAGTLAITECDEVPFQAQVRWAQRVDRRVTVMASLNRMGVRFISPPSESYYQLLSELWQRSRHARTSSVETAGACR